MSAEITFETNGEEFKNNGVSEVFKVLREVQECMLRGEETGKIYDDDNKTIGHWTVNLPFT